MNLRKTKGKRSGSNSEPEVPFTREVGIVTSDGVSVASYWTCALPSCDRRRARARYWVGMYWLIKGQYVSQHREAFPACEECLKVLKYLHRPDGYSPYRVARVRRI